MNRRNTKLKLILGSVLMFAALTLGAQCPSPGGSGIGRIWFDNPSPRTPATGLGSTMYQMTNNGKTYNLYHTHPSWSYDGNWIIFTSNRNGVPNIYAVNSPNSNDGVCDYLIVQLTDISGTDSFFFGGSTEDVVVSAHENVLYYVLSNSEFLEQYPGLEISRWSIHELNFGDLIADALAGTLSGDYIEKEQTLTATDGVYSVHGGITLDYSGNYAYVGISREFGSEPQHQQTIWRFGLAGSIFIWDILYDSRGPNGVTDNYLLAHLQANPYRAGELLFSNKKNGNSTDTPEHRMYFIADADGPLDVKPERLRYGKRDGPARDNVTHEVWVDANTVGFLLTSIHPEHDHLCTGFYTIGTDKAGDETALGSHVAEVPTNQHLSTGGPQTTYYHAISHGSTQDANLFIMEEWKYFDNPNPDQADYTQTGRIWKYYKDADKFVQLTGPTSPFKPNSGDAHVRLSQDGKYISATGRSGTHNLYVIPVDAEGGCYPSNHVLFSQQTFDGTHRKATTDYIQAHSTFTANADAELVARNYVKLGTGFKALAGSKFRAAREDVINDGNCTNGPCLPGLRIVAGSGSRPALTGSVNTPSVAEVQIYPNPTQQDIVVRAPEEWLEAELTVVNVEGKIVYQQDVQRKESFISASNWKPGLYVLTLDNGESRLTFKVMKD